MAHQFIMSMYSNVMTLLPTAALQKMLGESVKQILNAVSNNHLVDYNNKTTFNNYHQRSTCAILSALTLVFQTAEVAIAIFQEEKAVVEKHMVMKKRFL